MSIVSNLQHPENTLPAWTECENSCAWCSATCRSFVDFSQESRALNSATVRLLRDCADIAHATAQVLSRRSDPNLAVIRAQVQSSAQVAKVTADRCKTEVLSSESFRKAAEASRRAEDACITLFEVLAPRAIEKQTVELA